MLPKILIAKLELFEQCSPQVYFTESNGMSQFYRSLDSDDASTSAGGIIVNGTYNRNTLEDIVKRASSQDQEVQLSAVQQVSHFKDLCYGR